MAQKKVTDIKEVDNSKQLDSALGQIERQFGSGTVMRMGEKRHEKFPSAQRRYGVPRPSNGGEQFGA